MQHFHLWSTRKFWKFTQDTWRLFPLTIWAQITFSESVWLLLNSSVRKQKTSKQKLFITKKRVKSSMSPSYGLFATSASCLPFYLKLASSSPSAVREPWWSTTAGWGGEACPYTDTRLCSVPWHLAGELCLLFVTPAEQNRAEGWAGLGRDRTALLTALTQRLDHLVDVCDWMYSMWGEYIQYCIYCCTVCEHERNLKCTGIIRNSLHQKHPSYISLNASPFLFDGHVHICKDFSGMRGPHDWLHDPCQLSLKGCRD